MTQLSHATLLERAMALGVLALMRSFALLALPIVLAVGIAIAGPAPALAEAEFGVQHYLCDGESLLAEIHNGAVDAIDIPNSSAGTVPGAFVVLQWRGISLQLPRSNNAGQPSYTDGRWWWSSPAPDQIDFEQLRGTVHSYSCQRISGETTNGRPTNGEPTNGGKSNDS
jgi:hypothetical protein